jgi:hypothetical protein
LDFPICKSIPSVDAGEIVVPLRLRIYGAGLPDPMQVISLRKRDPSADGCFSDPSKPSRPAMTLTDSFNAGVQNYRGWMPLDRSGRGYASASAYRNQLLNAKDLESERINAQEIARNDAINLVKFGHVYVEVTQMEETVTINGIDWRHRLIATYDTSDPAHAAQGRLIEWNESYEHDIDDTHILRRQAHYNAMIVADPEWIAARRNLLLKLVQAVRIEPMTQAEVDAAVAQYRQQREQGAQEWRRKH